ncbi:TonB family protein [Pedobacter sp. CAN_A7]|uniref:M56 family metallopeptidase n=1 Tax=Pedobacter sp. CAN_A7 TaxID=2787722 RepID=UPI0018CB1F67
MSWAHYLLQANIYLVVFYAFYKLLLAKETYFKLNRIYLLTAALLALLIPYLRVDWLYTDQSNNLVNGMNALNDLVTEVAVAAERPDAFSTGNLLAMLYFLGLLFFTSRLLYQLWKINRFLKADNHLINRYDGKAFSFFKRKIIDPTLPELKTIEQHEQVHTRQWHSLDVVLIEILSIICWFNPIIYLYKNSLKSIHEYLADEEAAQYIGDKQKYALLLLSKSFGVPVSSLTNSFFNQSLLKNRIKMLNQEKSPKKALLKYGLYLPVFGLTLLFSSATLRNNEQVKELTESIPLEQPLGLAQNIAAAHSYSSGIRFSQDTVFAFTSIDQQPTFQGGMDKFYEYLSKSVKYPKEAVAKNVQGKVFLSFIVEKNGELTNINVDRKLGAGTDEEAVRVLEASPRWIPGKIAGKPVRVKYNIPISFALSKKNTDSVSIKVANLGAKGPANAIKPLYIVDGIKLDDEKIKSLDSKNIASVTVLKDENAVTQYGAEAKGGVILITTKANSGTKTDNETKERDKTAEIKITKKEGKK